MIMPWSVSTMPAQKVQHAVNSAVGNSISGGECPSAVGALFHTHGSSWSAYTGVRVGVPGLVDIPKSVTESCSWLHLGIVCI